MLTLKAPLELKCNPAMISSHEAFYHRITGNYGLLSAEIDREDLLHVVTAPLELYLEEGGAVRIAQNTNIRNSQETKLDIINNFLNRVTVMEEANLTYQDRVFITDVLKKLGVREVERFMVEVFRLKEETRSTQRLIGLYWNHLEELRERVEVYHSREKERRTVEERAAGGQAGVTLHEDIMNRLQTGAIYQIMNSFAVSHSGNSLYVTRQELQSSEQKRVALQILLQKLRQEVRQETLPLSYRHENGYRQSEPEDDSSIEAWAASQISSSVLLNLIDNLYLSLSERQHSRSGIWLSMENALYQAAENTFYRLKAGFYAQWQTRSEQNLWNIRQQQLREQEFQLVQSLLRAGWEARERFSVLWNEYGEQSWQLLSDEAGSAEIFYAEGPDSSQEPVPGMERERKEGQPPPGSAPFAQNSQKVGEGGTLAADTSRQEKGPEPAKGEAPSGRQEGQFRKAAGEVRHQQQERDLLRGENAGVQLHFLHSDTAIPEELSPAHTVRELARWVQEGREQFYRTVEQYLRLSEREYRESAGIFRIMEAAAWLKAVTERLVHESLPEEPPAGKTQAEAVGTGGKPQEQKRSSAQALLAAGQEAEERLSLFFNRYGEQSWQFLGDAYTSAEIFYAEARETSTGELPSVTQQVRKEGKGPSGAAPSSKEDDKGEQSGRTFAGNAPGAEKGIQRPGDRTLTKRQEEPLPKAVPEGRGQSLQPERTVQRAAGAELSSASEGTAAPGEAPSAQSVREWARWVLEGWERFYRTAEQYVRLSDHEYRESAGMFRILKDSRRLEAILVRLAKAAAPGEVPGGKSLAEAAETVLLRWQEAGQEQGLAERKAEAARAGEPGSIMAEMQGENTGWEIRKETAEPSLLQGEGEVQPLQIFHREQEQGDIFYLPGEAPLPSRPSEAEASGELVRQIREMNRQNLEKLEIYREIQHNSLAGAGKKPANRRDMRRDSLKALQNPEELLREYEEERQGEAREEQNRVQRLMELLPAQTRRAYEKLEQYRSVQKEGLPGEEAASGSMGLLLRDIRQASLTHRETEQTRDEELRRIQETSETVLERWREASPSESQPRYRARQEQTVSQIDLIHKSTQQQANQEVLEYLEEQNRITQGKQKVVHEESQDSRTVQRTVHHETRQVVNRGEEELAELIQKGVRQQMGALSEQIYSRLEKRLQNEKKRRGF